MRLKFVDFKNKKHLFIIVMALFTMLILFSVLSVRSILASKQYPQYHFKSYADSEIQKLIQAQRIPEWLPSDASNISIQYCRDQVLCLWLAFDSKEVEKLPVLLGFKASENQITRRPTFLPPSSELPTLEKWRALSGKYYQGPILFDTKRGHLFIVSEASRKSDKHNRNAYYWIE